MVKKSSFPSTVLSILKAIPCQMCIYWFSNMDFQFCQPKFGALPVLQKYPTICWNEMFLGETFLSILDTKCLKVRCALIHRGLFQIKATHPISAKKLSSLHNDRQVRGWCYIFGQHGLPWPERDEPSPRKDDMSYFPCYPLSLCHQSGIGLDKMFRKSEFNHSHLPKWFFIG